MGWIQPMKKLDHEEAYRHRGQIYLHQRDLTPVAGCVPQIFEGRIVDFFVYADPDGLGAEKCRVRCALRLAMGPDEVKELVSFRADWSSYLRDSEFYPEFEEKHGVTLRKYTWPLAFVLMELWGQEEELAAAAFALSSPGSSEGESDSRRIRLLVAAEDLAKAQALPASPEVSQQPVLVQPLVCYEVSLHGAESELKKAVVSFLRGIASPSSHPQYTQPHPAPWQWGWHQEPY